MADKVKRKKIVSNYEYSWYQIRDCVEGSNAVKRQQEIYLPMPSGMIGLSDSVSNLQQENNQSGRNLSLTSMPWYHPNPAYRAYLHRARFPDICSPILRGIVGVATKMPPEIDFPSAISNMESVATVCGKDIESVYSYSINEVMQTGKFCYAVDVVESGELAIVLYSSERNVDWNYETIGGKRVLSRCTFIEQYGDEENEEKSIEYRLENGIAVAQKYINGKEDGDEIVLQYKGKTLDSLPIFFANCTDNTADINIIPMLGVSDIALTIYRKDADLSQAQYMTCNPTLFIYGVSEDQAPQLIGSTVTVTISNPQAKAEYPATDTSALDHVKQQILDLYQEAISMGAQILGIGSKGAESGEALSIREAASGATLVGVVQNISSAINNALIFAAKWAGVEQEEIFKANKDFASKSLTSQEMTALVSSWVQRAISHDSLLNKFRDAGYVDPDTTNKQEKNKIKKEDEDFSEHSDPGFVDDKEKDKDVKDESI